MIIVVSGCYVFIYVFVSVSSMGKYHLLFRDIPLQIYPISSTIYLELDWFFDVRSCFWGWIIVWPIGC